MLNLINICLMAATVGKEIRKNFPGRGGGGGGEVLPYKLYIWVCAAVKGIFRNDTTTDRLRNSEMRLALPQLRTDYVRESLSYSGAALWNSHPTDIRVSKPLGVSSSETKWLNASLLFLSMKYVKNV